MRRVLASWVGILLVVAAAGCGVSSPELDSTEAVEEHVEAQVNRLALHPDEWFIYASCPQAARCTADLEYKGAPGAPLATNRYAVLDGIPRIEGRDQISAVLHADQREHCTDRYLATKDPSTLIPCSF